MRRLVGSALALIIFAVVAPKSSAEVKVRYFKAQPTFVSTMPSSMVEVLTPAQTTERRVGIKVGAFNLGQSPDSLGYENVSVRTAAGVPVPLISYEQLQHSARVRAGWATFFASFENRVG